MEPGIGDSEQMRREELASERAREEQAVEKLNEAEQRKADKDSERDGQTTGDDQVTDRAVHTWQRLAGSVSPENVPSE
jgi:hypothetical protein